MEMVDLFASLLFSWGWFSSGRLWWAAESCCRISLECSPRLVITKVQKPQVR